MEKDDLLVNGAEAVSLFCRLYMNTKKNLPVRSSYMGLLILTVKNDKPVTPVEAANFFKVKKPMITTMVNSLEKDGYLKRAPSETDKRSYLLIPTEKTIRLVGETYDEYFKTMHTLCQEMGTETYQAFVALLMQANYILLKGKE